MQVQVQLIGAHSFGIQVPPKPPSAPSFWVPATGIDASIADAALGSLEARPNAVRLATSAVAKQPEVGVAGNPL